GGALGTEQGEQPFVDPLEVGFRQDAASDVGLVGDDDDDHAELGAKSDQGGRGAGDQRDRIRIAEVVALLVDRAVAVDQGEAPGHVAGAYVAPARVARTPAARKAKGANWPSRA